MSTGLEKDDPLLTACLFGNWIEVKNILRDKSYNIHIVNNMRRNAIHLAVINGSKKIIHLLIQAGVDVNLKDIIGRTPLHFAILRYPSLEVATLLLNNGAIIPKRSKPTDPGLFLELTYLAKPTHLEISFIILLLKHGASLEDPSAPGGRQALHYAAMSNNAIMVRDLLEMGAYPYAKNHLRKTPAEMAALFKCSNALFEFEYYALSKITNRNF